MPTANGVNNMGRGDSYASAKGGSERGSARGGAGRPWRRAGRTRPRAEHKSQALRSELLRAEYEGQDPSFTRGYTKLADAAQTFNFDFKNKTVLDIGSSTGGFTKYALDSGAKKVIAVEKGTNQMEKPLRFDPRIELHEKTDIFDFKLEAIAYAIDVVVADVSFLSLKPVLKYVQKLKTADFLVMFKPQFEAKPEQLNKGIVKNEKIRREIIKNFELWLKNNGFIIIKKRDNTLQGKHGNLERFYWLKLTND